MLTLKSLFSILLLLLSKVFTYGDKNKTSEMPITIKYKFAITTILTKLIQLFVGVNRKFNFHCIKCCSI